MRDLHAVQFDGTTFGMEVECNTAAFRYFRKQVKLEPCKTRFGIQKLFTVPYTALAAIMGESHWLVSEKKCFDRITIDDFCDGILIYVKYKDGMLDFEDRR